jgi:hypothetical protein
MMLRNILTGVFMSWLLLIFTGNIYAESIPRMISFQGMLKDDQGNPVNDTVGMTFKLYTERTGGSPVWTETQENVNVENGIYNVMLGEVNSLSGVKFDKSYWLEIEVNGSVLSPRYRLGASPYALSCEDVGQGECLWEVEAGSNNIYRLYGRVGIGTDVPSDLGKVHVSTPQSELPMVLEGCNNYGTQLLLFPVDGINQEKAFLAAGAYDDGDNWHVGIGGYKWHVGPVPLVIGCKVGIMLPNLESGKPRPGLPREIRYDVTEALDVNGRVRIRNLPSGNNLTRVIVANNDGVLHTRDAKYAWSRS